jgi:hypothetical protein
MPQTTKTKGAGAFSKSIAPVKTSSAAKPATTAKPAGRIGNLGAFAHAPKKKSSRKA